MGMRCGRSLLVALGCSVVLSILPRVWGQSDTWQAIEFFNLTGGLNDSADPTVLSLQEASDLQNVVLTTFGGVARRDGFAAINSAVLSAASTATGISFYKQEDGTRFLVATWSTGATDTIQKMDYGAGTTGPDGTWDDVSGSLSLSWADDVFSDFATGRNALVIEDGVTTTAPYVLSGAAGTTFSLAGSPPNASMVEYHKRILWLAGNSAIPSRVSFSNLDTIDTWTSTDTIDIETGDGQTITALKSALDCLYVFKQFSIFRICGSNRDDFTVEQMVKGIGTPNNQAVTIINNQFVFMTSQGDVAVYDGGVTVQIISSKIETTLTGLNLNRLNRTVTAAFDEGTGDEDFYACVSTSGNSTHNRLLQYDTLHKAWLKHVGINCNSLAVYEIGTQQLALAFSDYAGRVHRYPTGSSDNGASISAAYLTGHLSFGIPQQKTFRRLQPVFVQQTGNTNLTVEYRVDFATTGTSTTVSQAGSGATWDGSIYDTASWADLSTTIANIDIHQTGNFLAWRIANTSEPFLVRGVRLWYEPTGRVQ